MKYLKALGLAMLGSTVALFIGVGSAGAVELAPDFTDTWTGVDITDCSSVNDPNNPGPPPDVDDACEFTATVNSLPLTAGGTYSDGGSPVLLNCQVILDILIWDDGSTKVREVTINNAIGGPAPAVPCAAISTTVDPETPATWWDNQICEEHDSNPSQYWDRVDVSFYVGAIALSGRVFVLLDRKSLTGGVRAGWLAGEFGTTNNFFEGEFGFDPNPAFVVNSNEDDCSWPELNA